jgi:hypothetical protein
MAPVFLLNQSWRCCDAGRRQRYAADHGDHPHQCDNKAMEIWRRWLAGETGSHHTLLIRWNLPVAVTHSRRAHGK